MQKLINKIRFIVMDGGKLIGVPTPPAGFSPCLTAIRADGWTAVVDDDAAVEFRLEFLQGPDEYAIVVEH